MADYYPLIARAVAELEKNTGEARRALYERARTALIGQLRGVVPAVSESDITRERLGLEEAIRKVEAEAARRARSESIRPEARKPPRSEPPPPPPPPSSVSRPPPSPPERPPAGGGEASAGTRRREPRSLLDAGLRDFRQIVDETVGETRPPPQRRRFLQPQEPPPRSAERAAPTEIHVGRMERPPEPRLREPYPPEPHPGEPHLREPYPPEPHPGEPRLREPYPAEPHPGEPHLREPYPPEPHLPEPEYTPPPENDYGEPFELEPPPAYTPPPPVADDVADATDLLRPSRGIGRWVAILLIAALAGVGIWQYPNIAALLGSGETVPPQRTTTTGPQTQPKISDRITPGDQTRPATTPDNRLAPAVAQRVVLYEEDPDEPQGKQFVGSVIWRTEMVSPGPGKPPEVAVRADVEIPERHMTMNWSLRRNTDQTLPASHTIEIIFRLPPDFPGGGITNVPGILMKQGEQARGAPLAGLAVKVTDNFFLIGLSATTTDEERNIKLLKERPWFDVPIVYDNNRRAILAMEKGTPGERVFAEAFKSWGQ